MKRLQFIGISGALVAALFTAGAASAEVTVNIWDDGTDLYMSASGDYDFSGATEQTTFSGMGLPAVCWPTFIPGNPCGPGLFGWETDLGNASVGYVASFDAPLTATLDSPPEIFVDGGANPIMIVQFNCEVYRSTDSPVAGTTESLAIFGGATVASMGMVIGETQTCTWGGGGANEVLTINVIEGEPTPVVDSTWGQIKSNFTETQSSRAAATPSSTASRSELPLAKDGLAN